jgi:uncharacterized protein (TIGR03083 family)
VDATDLKDLDLNDLDPFDIFDTEAARLDRHFAGLDDAGWLRPSRCAGWSARDVLAHLAGEELYNHACFDGDLDGFFVMLGREGVGGAGGFGDFNGWCVRRRAGLPVDDVLEEWRVANGITRREMRARGRDGVLATSAGPYPVGLQAFHYDSEYATHADDVDAPVAPGEEPARTRWRAAVGVLALREQDAPVGLEATAAGYRVRVGAVAADLSPPDFVAATTDRLPADHPLDQRIREALVSLA